MTFAFKATAAATLLALAACSQAPAEAPPVTGTEWTVDSEASELAYVTVKLGEIAEANSFETVTGGITANGAATIEIDLASVSTGIDIRDERMRDVFFVVADNPTATVTAQIDPAEFEALSIGASTETTLDGTLTLNGAEAPFQAAVTVTRAGPDRILAVSDAPVIIYTDAFGLSDGIAQLKELAGLDSITPAVPVTFSLAFDR